MNLKQTMKTLRLNNEKQQKVLKEETLYQKILTSALTVLISEELTKDQLNSVGIRSEGFGLEWCDYCTVGRLEILDRVLELNKVDVFRITNNGWSELKKTLMYPVQAVFMRMNMSNQEHEDMKRGRQTMAELRYDICQIQSRLEKKLLEGKKTCNELELVVKERDSLGKENMRLLHRIAFLEDHTKELQTGLKQVMHFYLFTLESYIDIFRSRPLLRRLSKQKFLEFQQIAPCLDFPKDILLQV